ncbi:MAG: Tic22 family protein [Oscillatoria sp. PMC 1068.18]|nr:Tic22 family protein [Oscillatoria sp. PMC 1076.18]MEC4989199.1 Tic22 family protein [Oscillatoria sp. PMC 1068.18]
MKFGFGKSLLFGSLVTGLLSWGLISPALALPEAEVMEKLRSVPVFTVTDAEGAPLVVNDDRQNERAVAGVFISQDDANAFLERLKRDNPDLGNQVQVTAVSLGAVYQLGQENRDRADGLSFAFVPIDEQVKSAETLIRQGGQEIEEFRGVPLFVARAGNDQRYLTLQQGDRQMVPFFFEQEQLQTMVDAFKQQNPELATTVKVMVVNLEGVIETLRNSENQQLNQILLVPSQESMEFLRSLPGEDQ